MRGLKTQESKEFNRFWKLVQEKAAQRNCVFFGFAGEGREFSAGSIEGEDFSGWLVPADHADAFEQVWQKNSEALFDRELPEAEFTFAIWHKNEDTVSIEFKNF